MNIIIHISPPQRDLLSILEKSHQGPVFQGQPNT